MRGDSHARTALDLYQQAAAALGSGRIQGTFELALKSQGGSLHSPEPSWQAARVLTPDAGPLAARIRADCEWIEQVVFQKLLQNSFHGTAVIKLVKCPRRGLLAPVADVRETLRSVAAAIAA